MTEAQKVTLSLEAFGNSITKDLMISLRKTLSSPPPEGTPRDTTYASTNWLLSVRRSTDRTVGSKQRINSSAGEKTDRLLRAWKMMHGPIYLSNNTPYIGRLNQGYSPQSAAGFVERAYNKVAAQVDRRKSP